MFLEVRLKTSIHVCCDHGHAQTIVVDGTGIEWARMVASLLDGSADFYVHSPVGTDSIVGKCGICRAPIHCTAMEPWDGKGE